ncbi:hypothetical protein SpCBS45565_g02103 [Spizellomyces sp. 'palustris']|nr:hypothetical protein SpCBS45565_g02103 [Spizellomyces sp. 'palustris']
MDPLDPEYDPASPRTRPPQRQRPPRQLPVSQSGAASPGNGQPPIRPPPPPPGPPLVHLAWSEHRDPNGSFYYYNSITKESRWERPAEYRPPPPPPRPSMAAAPAHQIPQPSTQLIPAGTDENSERKVASPSVPASEHPIGIKKLPSTKWAIVLTSKDHEFFYNLETKESVWDMPDEIGDLIGQLIAEAMGVDIGEDGDEVYSEAELEEEPNEVMDEEIDVNATGTASKRKAEDNEEAEAGAKRRKGDEAPEPSGDDAKAETLTQEQKNEEFTKLLREMDVSPYSTWEKELPKIIHDRRYTLIGTLKERKQVFDQYCKVRVVELREEKKHKVKDTKEAYLSLLKVEVTYRTRWDDFSRKFKRDERFAQFDAKEREPLFKAHIAALKENELDRKRSETRAAKDSFIQLLRETKEVDIDASWRRIKRLIEDDRRYQAVRSSGEREEIFRDYIRKLTEEDGEQQRRLEKEKKERDRKAREEASLREREAQVRREQSRLNRERNMHRESLQKEDATTLFQTMLVDFVRNADAKWRYARETMERDSRWERCRALDDIKKERLFSEHLARLQEKRLAAFHSALRDTTDLTTTWDQVRGWILQDPRARKLATFDDLDEFEDVVKRTFERFQSERKEKARSDLLELLGENNFVRFHVKQAVVETRAKSLEKGEGEPKEGDEWGHISLEEIMKVLMEDKRYIQLDAYAEERDRLVKEHVRDLIIRYRAERGGTVDRTLVHMGK